MSYTIHTDMSWSRTQQDLDYTFEKWGVTEWTTNYPRGARLQGYQQSDIDKTVTLTYTKNGKQVNLQMGTQDRAVDNLRVLYLAIEAMRMNERRGLSEVLQSAYMQLEAPTQKRSPYEILQIMPDAPLEVAEASYRAKALVAHPDKGGDIVTFKELKGAIEAIRKEKK